MSGLLGTYTMVLKFYNFSHIFCTPKISPPFLRLSGLIELVQVIVKCFVKMVVQTITLRPKGIREVRNGLYEVLQILHCLVVMKPPI